MAANRMARNPSTARIQNRRLGEARVSLRKTFRISREALTWPLRGRGRSARRSCRSSRPAGVGDLRRQAPCRAFALLRARRHPRARGARGPHPASSDDRPAGWANRRPHLKRWGRRTEADAHWDPRLAYLFAAETDARSDLRRVPRGSCVMHAIKAGRSKCEVKHANPLEAECCVKIAEEMDGELQRMRADTSSSQSPRNPSHIRNRMSRDLPAKPVSPRHTPPAAGKRQGGGGPASACFCLGSRCPGATPKR